MRINNSSENRKKIEIEDKKKSNVFVFYIFNLLF